MFGICVRSWPCDAIVMRVSRIFHLSLAAWLAANGLCPAWFNPPSLQSAITYEMTTVSHPVSHLPWFHTSQQPNHSCEINERRWGVVGDSLITPAHTVLYSGNRQFVCVVVQASFQLQFYKILVTSQWEKRSYNKGALKRKEEIVKSTLWKEWYLQCSCKNKTKHCKMPLIGMLTKVVV